MTMHFPLVFADLWETHVVDQFVLQFVWNWALLGPRKGMLSRRMLKMNLQYNHYLESFYFTGKESIS